MILNLIIQGIHKVLDGLQIVLKKNQEATKITCYLNEISVVHKILFIILAGSGHLKNISRWWLGEYCGDLNFTQVLVIIFLVFFCARQVIITVSKLHLEVVTSVCQSIRDSVDVL